MGAAVEQRGQLCAVVLVRSTDAGSGVAYYARQASRDGGATWSRPLRGGVGTVWTEGRTLVRFARSTLRAWNAWFQIVGAYGPGVSSSRPWTGDFEESADGGSTWGSLSLGVNGWPDGEHLLRVQVRDRAGNVTRWYEGGIRWDSTPPTAPAVTGGSGLDSCVASATVTGAGPTDALSAYRYLVRTPTGDSFQRRWRKRAAVDVRAVRRHLRRGRRSRKPGATTSPPSPVANSVCIE
jgi:hypothetical protein